MKDSKAVGMLRHNSYLARPKSQIFKIQFELTSRFPGLMSLWIILQL